MQPIQVPTPPTLVSRLSIRSQADLQEQLRIKQTTERQEQKLYAPPTPVSFTRQLEEEELVQRELAEVKEPEAPSPDFPRMPIMRKEELFSAPRNPRLTPQSSLESVAEEEFTGFFARAKEELRESLGSPPPTPPKARADSPTPPPQAPPQKRRGRPASDFKTILTLRKEIRAKVSPPPKGLDKLGKEELQAEARKAGIDIMK